MIKTHLISLLAAPVANIYRRAAEIVQAGEQWYSCDAIHDATDEVFKAHELDDDDVATIAAEYVSQYSKAFGPEVPSNWFAYETNHHPFWNARSTCENPGEVTQYRMNALLLMAELVESEAKTTA